MIDAKKYLAKFKVLVTIFPQEDKAIELALASDFEDILQLFCCNGYPSRSYNYKK